MNITELVGRAHDNAVKHGFWDPPLNFGTAIALIHPNCPKPWKKNAPAAPWSGITVRKATRPFLVTRLTKPTASSMGMNTPASTGTRSPKAWLWNWRTL